MTVTVPALATTVAVPAASVVAGSLMTPFTPVTASGGSGTVTFALSGGTLPTGLAFSTATGQITGTPTTLLSATTFTVTATDSAAPAAQTSAKTFSLAVTPPALATTVAVAATSVISGRLITPFTPVTSSGGFGTVSFALTGGALPTGLAFSTSNGQISGTPTALLAAATFTVTATDSTTPTAQTSAKTFSLAVTAPALATTQAVPTTSILAGSLITPFTPVTSSGGFGTVSFALTGGTLPAGLAFSTSNGQISGTPTVGLATTAFTVTATDSTTPTAQTSTKTFSLTVTKITTTTTLTSSANSILLGQPVTFTANVTQTTSDSASRQRSAAGGLGLVLAQAAQTTPATGVVSFITGAATLCSNVPLVNGVATCTTTFTTSAPQTVTAVYAGTGTTSTSTSSVVAALVVTDQRTKTTEVIGRFMAARNNQLLTSEPDAGRQIDRLMEAGGASSSASGGAGFSAGGNAGAAGNFGLATTSRLGSGPDASDVMALRTGVRDRPLSDAIGANAGGLHGNGGPGRISAQGFGGCGGAGSGLGGAGFGDPCTAGTGGSGGAVAMMGMRFNGNADGATRFGFATSLREMTRGQADADSKRATELGYNLSARQGTPGAARPNPFDLWVEGKYASFRDSRGNADLDGHFGLFSVGTDYVLNPSLLVGTMVQFDSMQQRSNSQTSELRGHGWMAGPYATLRLSPNVFWQVRGAWGQSNNTVSPFLTYTDSFDSNRWLASSTLTGRWTSGAWSLRPSASISYMEDTSKSYADTFATVMPSVKSTLGQAKAGPEVGYRFDLGHTLIEPRAGMQVIWNFAHDTTAAGIGQVGGDNAGPAGVRGRAEVGVRATTSGGIGLDVSGSYDGIGTSGYSAVTGRASVRVPLN